MLTLNGYIVKNDLDTGLQVAIAYWQCNCAKDNVHRRSILEYVGARCTCCDTHEFESPSPSVLKCMKVGARFQPPSAKVTRMFLRQEVQN